MIVETITLSSKAKDQLVYAKRYTGIENWNVLCRWALLLSLAEPSIPPPAKIPSDSNVEMTWKVFGGQYHELFGALLKVRCQKDGLGTAQDVLATQFRLHLHRGISYLSSNRKLHDIGDLIKLAMID
jgi:DNA sulfur modification protein DndE